MNTTCARCRLTAPMPQDARYGRTRGVPVVVSAYSGWPSSNSRRFGRLSQDDRLPWAWVSRWTTIGVISRYDVTQLRYVRSVHDRPGSVSKPSACVTTVRLMLP